MARNFEGFPRITVDPKVMMGKPCIRGMRVTVGMILGNLGAGASIEELLAPTRTSNGRTFSRRCVSAPGSPLTGTWSSSRPREDCDRHEPRAGVGPVSCQGWPPGGALVLCRPRRRSGRGHHALGARQRSCCPYRCPRFRSAPSPRSETRRSVVQVRTEDTLVRLVGDLIAGAISRAEPDLQAGALVTAERERIRVRRLSP